MHSEQFDVTDHGVTKELIKWNRSDTTWTFGLFGTAIGAGVLFFPIRAGYGGWIPVFIMLVLAYPIAFLCHRALARFCLAGKEIDSDITQTVETYFGRTGSIILTLLYFLAICPLLWIYGVTLTNTFMAFWEVQLGYVPLDRGLVALVCLVLLAMIIFLGKNLVIRVMSCLVFPFICSLLIIAILLIPYWDIAALSRIELSDISFLGEQGLLVTIWLGIAIMLFSFNFSPIVSAFVISQRERYETKGGKLLAENKCTRIISRASVLMVFVVMFFSFSCLLTLPPQEMIKAKAANITVLSYLADYIVTVKGSPLLASFLEFSAPIIALIAVFKSFFGHYLGTLEGVNGLIIRFIYKGDRQAISITKLNFISMILIIGSTWFVAYLNPNILDMIEQIGAPIIACLLCFLPIYALYKLPVMAKYRRHCSNYFVMIIGILTLSNIVYKLL